MAELLCEMVPRACIYDPEIFGIWLQRILPRTFRPQDFRDTWAWQMFTPVAVNTLAMSGRVVIVPMCMTSEKVRASVFSRLRFPLAEYWLKVEPDELVSRINRRTSASREWSLARIDAGLRFEAEHLGRPKLVDGMLEPRVIAELLCADLDLGDVVVD